MLIRVSDEYVALLDFLNRNGIKYEIVGEEYQNTLKRRAETLNEIGVIDLNKVKFESLINEATNYMNNKLEVNKYSLDGIFIQHYNSILEAANYDKNIASGIGGCCNKRHT